MSAYVVIYDRRSAYGFGAPLKVLWEAPIDIARVVCGDSRTCGSSHFLGWTHVHGQDIHVVSDDGRYNVVLDDLGVNKINRDGMPPLLSWRE